MRDMTERRRVRSSSSSTRRMSEFLAMLAHELRNPLAPIRNAVGILQMHERVDPTRRAVPGHHRPASARPHAPGGRPARRGPHCQRQARCCGASGSTTARSCAHSVEAARPLAEARRQRLAVELPRAAAGRRGRPHAVGAGAAEPPEQCHALHRSAAAFIGVTVRSGRQRWWSRASSTPAGASLPRPSNSSSSCSSRRTARARRATAAWASACVLPARWSNCMAVPSRRRARGRARGAPSRCACRCAA